MIKSKECLKSLNCYETDKFEPKCILKLDSNENCWGVSKKVLAELKKIDETTISRYPFYGEVIGALSKKYSLSEENILTTNGADEALSVIISTYLEAKEELLCFIPTFSMPKIYACITNANFRGVDYYTKWEFDAEKLMTQIKDNTKLLYITSPNNPTGELAKVEDIEKILKNYPNVGLILDITYISFSDENVNYFELVEKYDNLFIVKSFSKDYALAGLRFGAIFTQNKNIQECKKVISPYSTNSLAAKLVKTAIFDKDFEGKIKKEVKISRDYLASELSRLGYKPYPSQANFILCDFGEKVDFIYQKLKNAGILTRKFNGNELLKNCLRITLAPKKDLEKVVKVLEEKKLLVFDLDGVVFDVTNSYRQAIIKTFEHFCKDKTITNEDIKKAKEIGGLNCDWDLTKYLLSQNGYEVSLDEVTRVFQEMFFDPNKTGSKGLIDNEKLDLPESVLKSLAANYDFAVFTGRPRAEAIYSLEKYGILKYFSKIISQDELEREKRKPHPEGLNIIKNTTSYKEIYYFGDTIDDIKSANAANVLSFGVTKDKDTAEKLKNEGAKSIVYDMSKLKDFLKKETR